MKYQTTATFLAAIIAGVRSQGTICAANDLVRTPGFNVVNSYEGTSGSQCLTVSWADTTSLGWSTTWSWEGDAKTRKSFAAARWKVEGFTPISDIISLPTTWKWSYEPTSNIIANVAYDIRGASVCGSALDWNLQVWLAKYGSLKPPGSLVATASVNATKFDVYRAVNNGIKTHTFVAKSAIKDFTGDLTDFVDWTVANENVLSSWCIYSIQAGTEAYRGKQTTFRSIEFRFAPDVVPPTTTVPPPAATTTALPQCANPWGQCGGSGWSGPRCCKGGTVCKFLNEWHSQCLVE